ncbi:protein kinase domain-containing protein [Anaerosporobacter faecicola]|uniref:protein kinase domain-containing protein n=1 Tax=Anaerosporobacter faecicola TaxID=2718714 RepID=UPI00143946C4|nr:protein kinase [Anaerosporobacter faecicola]
MNNFDPHVLEPFWESWYIDSLIGEGSFGYVYKIRKEEFGQKYYSALKIISLPKTEAEAKEILYENTNQDTATQYFREVAEILYKEIQIMEELKGKTNIVSFEDHKIIPKENGVGYYILIRMELLTCLNDYIAQNNVSTRMLLTLAKDVCKALQICQRRNIIHRDIKPANIFVSDDGDFKLGDFGIARQLEGMESGLSIKGTYSYMAPEVYMGNPYDERADIYSLGMVLYYFLNKKHVPFTDPSSVIQRYGEKQEALKKRFAGEEFPDPLYGTAEFVQIVKKACAYNQEERYGNAEEMLEALMLLSGVDDRLILDSGNGMNKTNAMNKANGMNKTDAMNKSNDTNKTEGMKTDATSILYRQEKEEELTMFEPTPDLESTLMINPPVNEYVDDEEDEATVILSSPNVVDDMPQVEAKPVADKKNPSKRNKGKIIFFTTGAVSLILVAVIIFLVNYKNSKEVENPNQGEQVAVDGDNSLDSIMNILKGEDDSDQELAPEEEKDTPPSNIDKNNQEGSNSPATVDVEDESAEEKANVEDGKTDTEKTEEENNQEKEYIVEKNDKGYTDYEAIEKLEQVTSLTLMNNKLTNTKGLSKAVRLTYLNLEGNKINKLDGLDHLTNLEVLNLQDNKIKDITTLGALKTLNTLILTNNEVADIKALNKLTALRELRLNGNSKLKNIDILKNYKELQVLDISNTKVKDISCLYELEQLTIVNVQGTSVSSEQIKKLKKKLPNCTVIE